MGNCDGKCGHCGFAKRMCMFPEDGSKPEVCTTVNFAETLEKAAQEYQEPEMKKFAAAASRQERACYETIPGRPGVTIPLKPRLVEIMEFCQRMGYQHIGLAFCGGLHSEGMAVTAIFESNGFKVTSVMCKIGAKDKSWLGLTDEDKIVESGHETMCNPIGQAMVLNAAKTDFNVVLGLCVGHDSMFFKYAEAPTTVLVAKDRLLGHNPLAAVYAGNTYYRYLNKNK